MNEKPLEKIDELINIIYTPDQDGLDQAFLQVLDSFGEMIREMSELGYMVDMTEELVSLQEAYIKKDYIELADSLLYEIKPQLQGISI